MRSLTRVLILAALVFSLASSPPPPPLRLAIAGLVHGHVSGFLRAAQARKDVEIAGVFDRDAALGRRYAERYNLSSSIVFTDLDAMLDRMKPDAVASFTNTLDHPVVVEAAAARRVP